MQLLEFAQRFLNYKALVSIINQQTGKEEFTGMFMDCPYRFCRFSDVKRVDLDRGTMLVIYVVANSGMYYNTTSHFLDPVIDSVIDVVR